MIDEVICRNTSRLLAHLLTFLRQRLFSQQIEDLLPFLEMTLHEFTAKEKVEM